MNDRKRSTQDSEPQPKEQKPKESFEQTAAQPDANAVRRERQKRGGKAGRGPTNPV